MRENLTYGLMRGQGKQSGKYRNCALVLLYTSETVKLEKKAEETNETKKSPIK